MHPWVVFGGTFDRMHAGHYMLFRAAAEAVQPGGKILIGVTGDALLKAKMRSEMIRPFEQRCQQVRAAVEVELGCYSPPKEAEIETIMINTKSGFADQMELEGGALVVSQETVQGGVQINKSRREKGMRELELIVVDLVTDEQGEKLSSTSIRNREATDHDE